MALLTGLLLAVSAVAWGSVVEPLGIDELVSRSTLVVRGKVRSSESFWHDSSRRIATRTIIDVDKVLLGKLEDSTVTVVTPGGRVGDIGQFYPGAPKFEPGEDVVLFLEPAGGEFVTVGMSLGKFDVVPGPKGRLQAVRDLEKLHFSVPGRGLVGPRDPAAPSSGMPLDDLLQVIERFSGR